jgi:hypothetical protein
VTDHPRSNNMTELRAVFTVTVETKPDGDYYFDQADLVRNVIPWIEGGLEDRDDLRTVTVAVQPAPADRDAVLETENARMRHELEVMYGGAFDSLKPAPADRAVEETMPPPALTEVGQLRMRVDELEDALKRADSLAQLGATCFREHHAGQIEKAYAVMGGWRFALATALGLEGDASWEVIHDRIAELRRMADEAGKATP